MRSFVATALFCGLLAGCSDTPGAAPAPVQGNTTARGEPSVAIASPYAACGDSPEPEACADDVEAALIAGADGAVRRSADTLWIAGSDGSTLPLVSGFPADMPMGFRYGGRLGVLGHGVEVAHFEGSEFLLVDAASTNQTHLVGMPVLAPGGSRFAAASLDLVAGYNPNGVQIWELRDQGPVLVWELRGGTSWGAADPQWNDDSTLIFTMHRPTADPATTEQTRMVMSLTSAGVHLDPAGE